MSEADPVDNTSESIPDIKNVPKDKFTLSDLFIEVSRNMIAAVNLSGEFIRSNTEILKDMESVFNFPQDPEIISNYTACAIWTFGLQLYMIYKNEDENNLKAESEIKTIMKFFHNLSLKIEALAQNVIKFSNVLDDFSEHLAEFTIEMQSLGFSIQFHATIGDDDDIADERNIAIGSGLMLSDKHQEQIPPLYVYGVNYADNTVTFDDVTRFPAQAQNQITGLLLREIQRNILKLEKTLPYLIKNITNEKTDPDDLRFTSLFYLMSQIIKFFHRSHETTHDHEKGYTWAMERVVINTTTFIRQVYKILKSIIEVRDTLELTYIFLDRVPAVRRSKYYKSYVPTPATSTQGFWGYFRLFRWVGRLLNPTYTPEMFLRAPYRKVLKHHFLPVALNFYPKARFSITLEPVWPMISDKEVIAKRWFKDDAYMVTGDTFKLTDFPHPKHAAPVAQPKKKIKAPLPAGTN